METNDSNGNTKNRALWLVLVINSGALLTIFGWGSSILLETGARWRQMDVDTAAIRNLYDNGSPGVSERLRIEEHRNDLLEERINQLEIAVRNEAADLRRWRNQ